MQLFKRITLIFSMLTALLLLGVMILLFAIDPNRYKSQIEAFAQNRANISLQINGDLSWSFFPQFGISIKETQISAINDPTNPVASVEDLTLSLKLIPLIQGNIDIKELHVDGLILEILTHPDGSQNIDSFLESSPKNQIQDPNTIPLNTTSSNTVPTDLRTKSSSKTNPKQRELTIAVMSFTNSQFNLENQQTKQQLSGDNIDFTIQDFQLEAPNFAIKSLIFNSGNLHFSDESAKESFDYQDIHFNLKNLILSRSFLEDERVFVTTLQQFNLEKGDISLIKEDKTLLLKPHAIRMQDLHYSSGPQDSWRVTKAQVQDLIISSQQSAQKSLLVIDKINITASNISPSTQGNLQFTLRASQQDLLDFELSGQSALSFQQISDTWGFKDTLLKADIKRFQNIHPEKTITLQLAGDMELSLVQDRLSITPLTLLIDEQKITGSIELTSLQEKQGTITLKGDSLDLGQYLTNKTKSSPKSEDNQLSTIKNTATASSAKRHLMIQTELQTLKMDTLIAQNIGVNALLQNDLITISNAKATILDGNIVIKGTVKTPSTTPIINGDFNIMGLPIKNVLDLLQKQLPITGNLNLNGQLQTQGIDQASIMKHLQGNVQVNISHGQLIGMDYEQLVCEGFSLLKKENFRKSSATPTTTFNKLSANATIRNGVISNNNLQIEIPGLAATGNGTINLNNKMLDYRIGLLLKESTDIPNCKIDQYLKNVTIPLHCHGSYLNAGTNLCGIDQNAIGKMIADLAKGKIESSIKENIQEILPPALLPKKQENSQDPKPKDVIKAFEGLFRNR